MFTKDKAKQLLIGKPLRNDDIGEQKYSVLRGLPILASDPISSIAYASEEILLVLIPAIGVLSYKNLLYISGAIILLLIIVTFSYRQTIHEYTNGGGSYIVATDNLGHVAGITAGASLTVDYVLTVAVSISSGTAAITSAFPRLLPYTVPICLAILLLIMIGNLRGIRDSSKIFSVPTYLFIATMLLMIICGLIGHFTGFVHPPVPSASAMRIRQPVTALLLLSAFANGCSALTGVEAVSNAVPNFKKPQVKNAQKVLMLLALFVFLLFGGVSVLANLYHVVPVNGKTVLSQIAGAIFGNGPLFYLVQITTAIILVLAANTSYSGFPLLSSIIARDGYAPRQLEQRGDRLSFSNGILSLTVVAAILIIVFRGSTTALIPLYAIGVFISFTLSQFGMFKHWLKIRGDHFVHKAVINGFGALVTAVVVVIIAITKFSRGAWIVIIVIPAVVVIMLQIKRHYTRVAANLHLSREDLESADIDKNLYRNRVIVPVESVNRASIRAIRYAETISENVVAFNVSIDEESGKKLRKKYAMLNTKVPLFVKYSPYRRVFEPLINFIESEEYDYKKGDMVTVIIPQFQVAKWWERILHNGSGNVIARRLLKYKHIVVATMPLR